MDGNKELYIKSSAMAATSSSLALASSILEFEIVELWTKDEESGNFHCPYVFVTEDIVSTFPTVIRGSFPLQKAEHKLSPKLCRLAKVSDKGYHWRILTTDTQDSDKDTTNLGSVYHDLNLPIKTEMSYRIQNSEIHGDVYIVGLSIKEVTFNVSKIKFLSGLGYAIYVAAFDLDEDENSSRDGDDKLSLELDNKFFEPTRRLVLSNPALSTLGGKHPEYQEGNLKMDHRKPVKDLPTSNDSDNDLGLDLSADSPTADKKESPYVITTEPAVHPTPIRVRSEQSHLAAIIEESEHASLKESEAKKDLKEEDNYKAPTWDPMAKFSFPVAEIPIKHYIPDELTFDDFTDLRHIADGSNSNIFLGRYNHQKVVVKIIKREAEAVPIAEHEFDLEHGILARVSHPHILKVLGAGRIPRRFLVMEWMGGGTLNMVLNEHQAQSGLKNMLFRKPSFTYSNILLRARDMADALEYLHCRMHHGATIIHRDLKPDNVGFTSDGCLKLFDFGLCTCVKSRENINEAYEMTGFTGSLRYMAPEVALKKPYTEKADVYSFGIMVWQMARDRVPFKGFGRADFLRQVVKGGERPKLDKSWPNGFSSMLTNCWHQDPKKRPSFTEIKLHLISLINENSESAPKRGRIIKGKGKDERSSSWF